MALRASGWEVAGWDPDPTHLDDALSVGAIDTALTSEDAQTSEADITFLCGPLAATLSSLSRLDGPGFVTDVTSVKASTVQAGAHLPGFVAGHPMAGSAVSGPRFASSHLFHGASWALCDDNRNDDAIAYVAEVVAGFGANPVILSAEEHDAHVATVSHLPRIIASALIELVELSPEATRLSAGSFRDLTRVAASGGGWWADILAENSASVQASVARFGNILQTWANDLEQGNLTGISERLVAAGQARSKLGSPVAEVRVVLFDRPGEVGKVGLALSESGVDLRDIQLRHAEYGGGGILTLSINANETDNLRSALRGQGFELEDEAG